MTDTGIRLRLGEFCTLHGEQRATVTSILARNDDPFRFRGKGEKQFTYGVAEILAWALFQQLRAQGIGAKAAADAVKVSGAAELFLEAMERKEDVTNAHLVIYTVGRRHKDLGDSFVLGEHYCDPDFIADLLTKESSKIGFVDTAGFESRGLRGLTAVSVMTCYVRCLELAKANKFKIDGAVINEVYEGDE